VADDRRLVSLLLIFLMLLLRIRLCWKPRVAYFLCRAIIRYWWGDFGGAWNAFSVSVQVGFIALSGVATEWTGTHFRI